MKSLFGSKCAIVTGVVALALVSSAWAQNITPLPINSGNPSCVDIVATCNIPFVQYELEISDVTTSSGSKCNSGTCTREVSDLQLGITFKVNWTIDPATGGVNVTDLTDKANIVLLGAVIGEGKKQSNAYCTSGATAVNNVLAPVKIGRVTSNETPTKLTFCWAPSDPCLQPEPQVAIACNQYSQNLDTVPNGAKHYIQALSAAKPRVPTNICGCSPAVAKFCKPGAANPSEACPEGNFAPLAADVFATTGANSCRIGGRVYYSFDC